MIGVDPSEDKTQIAKKVEAFEAEAKRKFVDEPANMKLLIVVDKLLTGFDAPSCTYLYIDMPQWQERKRLLNESKLDYMDSDFKKDLNNKSGPIIESKSAF